MKTVKLYSTVAIKNNEYNEEYKIVPSSEIDIPKNWISPKSPVGQALLGKSVGDTVEITLPVGKVEYKISKII